MKLNDLKPQWKDLTQEQKREIILSTNGRRLATYDVRKSKATTEKKKKTKKKSPTVSTRLKTVSGLASHVKNLSADEIESIKLLLQMK